MPWGWAPVTQPQPSSSQGLSQRRGLTFPLLGQLQQRSLPASHPKDSPIPALCVCATYVCACLCACGKLGVAERMGALYVPDCGVVPGAGGGCCGWVGGCGSWNRVHARVCACERALSSPKKGCPARGSCCFLSLFFLSLTQLKQGFLVNPFSFRRPQGALPGSTPFGLRRELWGPLKSGDNSPWREAETPEGTLAPLL